jgi:Na+/proline symporter
MGILIGSAVIPIALTIAWSKTTRAGAVSGALIGVVLALITWTSIAAAESPTGTVDIASLGGAFPMLYGNVVAILSSGLICVIVSLAQNKKYDFKLMNPLMQIVEADMTDQVKKQIDAAAEDEATLKKAYKHSLVGGGLLTIICVVIWPLPLYFSGYVFDINFFGFWVMIAVVWVTCAASVIIFMPIIEARHGFAKVFSGKKAE